MGREVGLVAAREGGGGEKRGSGDGAVLILTRRGVGGGVPALGATQRAGKAGGGGGLARCQCGQRGPTADGWASTTVSGFEFPKPAKQIQIQNLNSFKL
jgi:hypothetical protein